MALARLEPVKLGRESDLEFSRWPTAVAPIGANRSPLVCYIAVNRAADESDAMSRATLTFRVDRELKHEFASVARSMDRSVAQLLREYMKQIVLRKKDVEEYDAWFRDRVRVGLASANAGNLLPNENVEADFASRRKSSGRKFEQHS